jgi:hypothetical protein
MITTKTNTMKNNFTPGPWIIGESDHFESQNGYGSIEIYSEFPFNWLASVKGLHVGNKTKEEVEANAKLITAAPELLEALDELVDIVEGLLEEHRETISAHIDSFTLQTAKQAISKATGEKETI